MSDVAIVGGGIAGLWLLNRLRRMGYDAHLFEKTALGTGQTIASQGIIHGGKKFIFAKAGSRLAQMPQRWDNCMMGQGDVDLRKVEILSYNQELRFTNPLMRLMAKIGLNSPLSGAKLRERVLDIKSLIHALSDPFEDYIYKGNQPTGKQRARATIHTCGAGNMEFCALKQIQLRGLRMLMVKPAPFKCYAHYFQGPSFRPQVTITTHYHRGQRIWYLGGAVAEQNDLAKAQAIIAEIFPDVLWEQMQWASTEVIRSEPITADGRLPDGPKFISSGNFAVAWPSKLCLAPVLSDQLIAWLKERRIMPSHRETMIDLPPAPIALYPWETAEWK